jgi:SDR family mycofactocin-dependent oxidoreductase
VKLASEGADIIAVDLCAPVGTATYDMGTQDELDETARLVKDAGGRIITSVADVRSLDALEDAVGKGVDQFGRLDIVLANAGISTNGLLTEMPEQLWQEMLDINLTGVWKTVRASAKHIIAGGRGGAIVLISSSAGLKSMDNIGHYVAAKHGVTGLAKSLAGELAKYGIRVNSLHPTNVNTPMLMSELYLFRPDLDDPTLDDTAEAMKGMHLLPERWVEPEDISNAVLYLVSDEGRFVTGTQMVVDLGFLTK